MNLLPSVLVAATLIGGSANLQQVDLSSVDVNALQVQCEENGVNTQVIVGTPSDLEALLEKLCVILPSIKDCINITVPGFGGSDNEADAPATDTPVTDAPDHSTGIPETEAPDHSTNIPGNDSADKEESANQSYVEQVVALVNAERAKVNLPALTMSEDLNYAAQIRAKETVQSFSHTRPNGSSFSSVLKENGISYRGAGENIAWGQRTPEAVVNAWMNSEGHRANILNKNYTSIGVGYHLNGSTPYWAQLFTY